MSAATDKSSDTGTRRRQPLWPWLLMPLATLAIYYTLHRVRQEPPRAAPETSAPAETPSSGTESR